MFTTPRSCSFVRVILAGTLLSPLFVIDTSHAQVKPPVPTVTVEVAQPTHGNVIRWVSLPGKIKAQQEAVLYAKVPGYLKSISVDEGDAVKAGTTIAVLETPELSADLARYRAENEAAKVEYERMQQAIRQAPDLVMPVEMDHSKGKYDVAKANLERTQSLLSYSRITAPFSGIVTRRFVDVGAFIPAATSGSTTQSAAIVTMMNFSTVRVQVAVPEAEAPFISKGLPARIGVAGLADRKFEGKISRLAYALDDSTKTMAVEVELANPTLELRPGMYATVQLGVERHDGVLRVPAAALVMEKANAFVYVDAGSVAKKRPIKIGFNDGAQVEVLEGLKDNEQVILVGKRSVADGQAIQVTGGK